MLSLRLGCWRRKRSVSEAGRTGTKEVAERRSQAPNGSGRGCAPVRRDERERREATCGGRGAPSPTEANVGHGDAIIRDLLSWLRRLGGICDEGLAKRWSAPESCLLGGFSDAEIACAPEAFLAIVRNKPLKLAIPRDGGSVGDLINIGFGLRAASGEVERRKKGRWSRRQTESQWRSAEACSTSAMAHLHDRTCFGFGPTLKRNLREELASVRVEEVHFRCFAGHNC